MRKILLASVATLGAVSWAGLAAAQSPDMAQAQGQFVAKPLPYGAAGANNNNNYQATMTPPGTAMATGGQIAVAAGFMATPTPGTIVIHLGGKVDAEVQANWTSIDTYSGVTTPIGKLTATGTTTAGVGVPYTDKIQPIGIGSFMRLYPGVDGMAANGLRYGASVEIRQNFMSGNSYSPALTGSTSSAIPSGANTIGTGAASPSGESSAQTLFVRRAFTYLAGDQWGLFRLGMTDGVLGLFDNCIFTSQCWDYGVGNLNGGASEQMMPGNLAPTFVWLSQAGAEYDNAKAVYLSPQFFGFDFGVQYAPQMGNAYSDSAGSSPLQATPCGAAVAVTATGVSGCELQSSGAVDGSRWLNQVAVGVRYQGSFNGFEPKAYVMYETAGKTDFTGTQPAPGSAASLAAANNRKFDNLNFISAGLAASYAGFTFSADYIGGAINNQLSMRPTGGASMSAPLFGLKYTSGPLTVGTAIGTATFQGANQLVGISQRRGNYFSAGGYYVIAPGMAIVAEYQYLSQHQGDENLALGTIGGSAYNDIKGQGVLLGTVVNW
jgi:hypothetical protein